MNKEISNLMVKKGMGPPSKPPVRSRTTMTRVTQSSTSSNRVGKVALPKGKFMKGRNQNPVSSKRGYRGVRVKNDVRRLIKRNPRYRNMRAKGILTPIVENFMTTENCLCCKTPFKSACGKWEKRSAIDHHHELEKTSKVCYRGKLCQRCNTTEGNRSPATWMRVVHGRTPTAPEVKWAKEYKDGDFIRKVLNF